MSISNLFKFLSIVIFVSAIASCNHQPQVISIYINAPLSNQQIQTIEDSVAFYFHAKVAISKAMFPVPQSAVKGERIHADELLNVLDRANKNYRTVLITGEDIYTRRELNGQVYPEWGIMGLSHMPGKASLISTFRIKDKDNTYKIVLHELCHTLGIAHCPTETCYMADAKGKGTGIPDEHSFCSKCVFKIHTMLFLIM